MTRQTCLLPLLPELHLARLPPSGGEPVQVRHPHRPARGRQGLEARGGDLRQGHVQLAAGRRGQGESVPDGAADAGQVESVGSCWVRLVRSHQVEIAG